MLEMGRCGGVRKDVARAATLWEGSETDGESGRICGRKTDGLENWAKAK